MRRGPNSVFQLWLHAAEPNGKVDVPHAGIEFQGTVTFDEVEILGKINLELQRSTDGGKCAVNILGVVLVGVGCRGTHTHSGRQ